MDMQTAQHVRFARRKKKRRKKAQFGQSSAGRIDGQRPFFLFSFFLLAKNRIIFQSAMM
jgi:hypothetical protein